MFKEVVECLPESLQARNKRMFEVLAVADHLKQSPRDILEMDLELFLMCLEYFDAKGAAQNGS